jgi:signal peptidase
MEAAMDTSVKTPEPQAQIRRRSAAWRWTTRIVGALALVAVTLVVLALAAVTIGPKLFSYQALVVRSGSMSPTIPTGSIVFYRPVQASQVKVGDVIVFSEPGTANTRVTHRVYAVGNGPNGKYWQTKGDANGAPDPWQVPAVGTGWKAVWHVPVAGYVLYDIQSTYGRLLLLLVPAALLGAITLWEIWDGRRPGAPA